MHYMEYGKEHKEVIVLLHGGGCLGGIIVRWVQNFPLIIMYFCRYWMVMQKAAGSFFINRI